MPLHRIVINTYYNNGCKPLVATEVCSSRRDARDSMARWIRECRKDLNVILFKNAPGEYFATTVNGVWDSYRSLVEV